MKVRNQSDQDQQAAAASAKDSLPEWHRPIIAVMPLEDTPFNPGSAVDHLGTDDLPS
jgi:hypothetical protein